MTVLSDRYELGRLLGAGGMGDVHEAFDQRLGRRVALKLLRADVADPAARARFVREVHLAAAFTHPNVVTVFDVGVAEGSRPFSVMELVDGQTLHAVLAADGPLPLDETARIADGVLAGLAAAHARGLVHRDVKPANVLLGRDGSVKLTDFGIAKAVHDATTHLTQTGQVLGTPAYLAPEQVSGEPSGPATDVYAAGIVLYETLAGAPPFRGDSAVATAIQQRQAPVPPLRDRRADVAPGVERVVARALEKDPADRYPDADEMRAALRVAAQTAPGAEPTLAHLTSVLPASAARSAASRTSSRSRRWAPAAVAGAALGLALLGGAFALGGGDGESGRGAAAAEPSTSTATSTSTSTSTTTTTVPTPRTLAELAAVVAGNPTAYGPRGPELLDGLDTILSGDDEDGDTARELFDDVPGWAADGELDAEVAGLAQQLLVPYLEGTDDRGPGPKGKKDDDDEGLGFDLRDLLPGEQHTPGDG